MSRRIPQRRDLGDAISLEDALSVMVVIFVLFVLIMVPLINIDKIRLAKAEKDPVFQKRVEWISQQSSDPNFLKPYKATFAFYQEGFSYGSDKQSIRFIEYFTPEDSTFTVVRHDIKAGVFSMMQSIGLSRDAVFRAGRLVWSPAEGEWFTAGDQILIPKSEEAKQLRTQYQNWIAQPEVSP